MRKIRPQTGLWKYLEQTGVLGSGDEEKIKEAKRVYWKLYDIQYKRKKRKQKREFTISFNPNEVQAVIATAKSKGLLVSEYIRQATRADMNQVYVVPQGYLLKEVEQILLSYKRLIQDIAEKDTKKNWFGTNKNYEMLEHTITKIESYLHQLFRQAPPLATLVADAIKANPLFITTLTQLIQQYHDCQEPQQKTTNI